MKTGHLLYMFDSGGFTSTPKFQAVASNQTDDNRFTALSLLDTPALHIRTLMHQIYQ